VGISAQVNQVSGVSGASGASKVPTPSIVVVGGGLAGIAAAMRLAGHGVKVTLVEASNRLGGRATSFVDRASGQVLDNCQHVLMGCCTNLIDLYQRLGVADQIHWHHRLYFANHDGQVDELETDDLPAPMHMTRSLMGFKGFSLGEKIAIARGMLAIIRLGVKGRQGLAGVSFGRWLKDHGQPDGAVRKFWSVIVTSALNELPDRVDASYAVQVFQDGFLANERAYVMGLSAVPLVELYAAAQQAIQQASGHVLLSSRAQAFEYENGQVTAVRLTDGQRLTGDTFINGLPFDRLAKLCDPQMVEDDTRLKGLARFGVSPIIGIHMWFDAAQGSNGQPVMQLPHLILTQGHLQWLFNKGYDKQVGGQHLHGVISAAHDLVDHPAQQIIEIAVEETRRVLTGVAGSADAALVHARVIKEKRATFSAQPGIDAIRPTARGAISNLYLAGDWCQTRWPATMEGAVRSGYLAATAALEDRQLGPDGLVADLSPGRLYQLISG